LEEAAWRLAIGEQATEDLPQIAADALAKGIDSPSLRELAGLPSSEVRDAADLFRSALSELGSVFPDTQDALWKLVRRTAQRIVDGEVLPYEGALWMWREAWPRVDPEGDLRIFVGLASEIQDHPEVRAEIEPGIVRAARELLARPAPRQWIKLQAARGTSPVTVSRTTTNEVVAIRALDISETLAEDIEQWAREYEATFDPDDGRSGFASQSEAEAFVQRGRQLVDRLQTELGEAWHVEYRQEPTRPPGLRLRHA